LIVPHARGIQQIGPTTPKPQNPFFFH
jgi:hypothetical protein